MKSRNILLKTVLPALCSALLVICAAFFLGWSKAANSSTAQPEVRNSGTAVQWKYPDEGEWHDLVALTELRGAAGENGKDGVDGANGVDGKDGANGINGADGRDGVNGRDGNDGVDGKNAPMERMVKTVLTVSTAEMASMVRTVKTARTESTVKQ